MRFNNRTCALLGIPDLPFGAFEHIGNGKIKPQGGGGSWNPVEIVQDTGSSAVDFVQDPVGTITDTLDKADNWTEAVGEDLAKIDPGPAIGDLGESIDKNVIQPMSKDPVGSIAMIAAIATQQYYLIPYIAAANTALHGGKIEDIALSFGVAYAAGNLAPGISQAAGGGAAGAIAAGTTVGAGSGAAMAIAKGQDVGEAAIRGGIVGGVTAGVTQGVSAGKAYFDPPPVIGATAPAGEFGINYNKVGTGEFVINVPTAPTPTFGDPIPTPEYGFGITAPTSSAVTPLAANYPNIETTQLGAPAPAREFGLKADKYGTGEFGIDATKADGFGIQASDTPVSTQYALGSETNPLETSAKRIASKYLSGSILDSIYGKSSLDDGSISYRLRRKGWSGTDSLDTGVADTSLNLAAVNPDKFELRKYANPEGASTLISFKDNKPQQPIPTGYEEVETVGAAKGGFIKKKSVVQSKKNTLATTRKKGLAAKKS